MKLKFCSLSFQLGVLIEVQLFVRFDEDKNGFMKYTIDNSSM